MIIEGDSYNDIKFISWLDDAALSQDEDRIVVDKQQAAQLVEVLQKWLSGEEVE